MKAENCKFLYWDNAEKKAQKVYQTYKTSLAVVLVAMLIYGYTDQRFNPKDVHGSHSYTDYVSNWNDMSCSIWAVLNAIIALAPNSPTALYSAVSAFNAIAPTFSIGVAGAFWCLLPADRQSKDLVSLHQHGFLAVITVLDTCFSAAPIRWFHLFSTWIFAGLYSINTMVVYAIFGDSRDEIYPFLNYGEKFADAVKFDVMMTFGVQSAVFLFIFSLSYIKFFIHRKCLSKSGAQCRYNYCSCFSSESVSGDQESQQALNNSARDSLGSNRLDGFMNAKEKEAYTNCTYEVSYKSLPQSEL